MPSANRDAGFKPIVADNQFKEIIAQRDDLTVIDGGRMLPPSADTYYPAGTLVAQFTSGPNAGLYAPYDSANSSATDGSQKPVGAIYGGCDASANGDGTECAVVTQGFVFADLCLRLVSGVVTAGVPDALIATMGAKKKIVHGQNILAL